MRKKGNNLADKKQRRFARPTGQIFLWGYVWLMSLKLVLDWASLLSELVQIFRVATRVVEWWRSLYYPVFFHLHLNMPHWAMDVLGAGFALGNIAAALMAIKSRSINPNDSVNRLTAIFFTFLHYVRGFHFVVRDIARRNAKKALNRYLKQPLPYLLSTIINLCIAAVVVSVVLVDALFVKWSVLAFFYSLIVVIIFVAWIAANFDFNFFGRHFSKIYPIRWIVGVLVSTYLLNFVYAVLVRYGIIDWLTKNSFI